MTPVFDSSMFTAALAGPFGAVLLTVFLPTVASLIVDAVILLIRKKRVGPLLFAVAFTVAVAVAGTLMWQYGVNNSMDPASTESSTAALASTLLPFGIGGAVFALIVRQANQAIDRRNAARRRGRRRQTRPTAA